MRHDWSRLKVLDECNPGFQAGRTTANAILPVRTAAEHCVATKTEMAVLLDDLKWCFDTPANAVIELALMRLGVPAFYVTMLNDIDMYSVKSTATAAGLTLDLASHLGCQGVHRQLHGTGQGTVEGPLNWLPVADIVIAVARAASTNPVTMLNDIDMHSVKSTVTAAGLTIELASHLGCQGVHRQLHDTGHGTVEGPLNWLPVADIAISVARAASTNPVSMPTGGGAPAEVPAAVYVDDSALMQSGPE
jgi:spore maturation protein SpmB